MTDTANPSSPVTASEPITLADLKANAKFRGTLCLDMAHGAYENHYQSTTYPRLAVIKSGDGHSRKVKQIHKTTYLVDGVECRELSDVLKALNAAPPSPQESADAK
jgi:hypothetical protein